MTINYDESKALICDQCGATLRLYDVSCFVLDDHLHQYPQLMTKCLKCGAESEDVIVEWLPDPKIVQMSLFAAASAE